MPAAHLLRLRGERSWRRISRPLNASVRRQTVRGMDALQVLRHTLQEMVEILRDNGETHWSRKIEDDLQFVRAGDSFGAKRFLTYFGGMGSLNDVWLCQENGNPVAKVDETNINRQFEEAKGKAWALARAITGDAV